MVNLSVLPLTAEMTKIGNLRPTQANFPPEPVDSLLQHALELTFFSTLLCQLPMNSVRRLQPHPFLAETLPLPSSPEPSFLPFFQRGRSPSFIVFFSLAPVLYNRPDSLYRSRYSLPFPSLSDPMNRATSSHLSGVPAFVEFARRGFDWTARALGGPVIGGPGDPEHFYIRPDYHFYSFFFFGGNFFQPKAHAYTPWPLRPFPFGHALLAGRMMSVLSPSFCRRPPGTPRVVDVLA